MSAITISNSIASPSALQSERLKYLDSIIESGQVDDILALCNEAVIRVGFFGAAVPLPRLLTDDEFGAVRRALNKSDWCVYYNLFGFITGHKLVISEMDLDD